MKYLYKILVFLQLGLFVTSLFLPVFERIDLFSTERQILYGYEVLASGWWIIVFYHVAWYANLTMVLTYILLVKNKYKWALAVSIATALLTIDAYVYPGGWYAGFYLWNASMLVLVGVAWVALRMDTTLRMHTKGIEESVK